MNARGLLMIDNSIRLGVRHWKRQLFTFVSNNRWSHNDSGDNNTLNISITCELHVARYRMRTSSLKWSKLCWMGLFRFVHVPRCRSLKWGLFRCHLVSIRLILLSFPHVKHLKTSHVSFENFPSCFMWVFVYLYFGCWFDVIASCCWAITSLLNSRMSAHVLSRIHKADE